MIVVHCAHPSRGYAPLAYGMLLAYAKEMLSVNEFDLKLRIIETPCDVKANFFKNSQNVLLCANYIWNVDTNLAICRAAKEWDPSCITVHGGPSTPKFPEPCAEFLLAHPEVDFAARGEGEELLVELLQAIQQNTHRHRQIAGISTIIDGEVRHYPDRPLITDIDKLPSPYLTGIFDDMDISAWGMVPLETNRGCMYSCSFCDWLRSKLRLFDINRVKAEIVWIAEHHHPSLYIIDANFGILKRDVEITKFIGDIKSRYGFPKRLEACFAKNTKQHLLDIVSHLAKFELMARGIIAVQSRDQHTLDAVHRQNIKIEEIEKLSDAFKHANLPLTFNLMLGLPGATIESYIEDLRYFYDQPGMVSIHRTVMTPNAPMANPSYKSEFAIEEDEHGYIISTSTMTAAQMESAKTLTTLYNATHPYYYKILKYQILYLRSECGLGIMDMLQRLNADLVDGEKYPLLSFIAHDSSAWLTGNITKLYVQLREEAGWEALHREFFSWAKETFDIVDISVFEQVTLAQDALMPVDGRVYPHTVNLLHDVTAWERDIAMNRNRPLGQYPAAKFTVNEPCYPYPEAARSAVGAPRALI